MSYVLPDEPRGAIRPELAVSPLWPLLTLMLVGPLVGFVWLAFNSWALGCRQARRHTLIAVIMIPSIGLASVGSVVVADLWLSETAPENLTLVVRLCLVVIQSIGLGLAFWMMWDQDDAEAWRKTYGEPLGNGARLFFILFVLRILLGGSLPATVRVFAFWTGG